MSEDGDGARLGPFAVLDEAARAASLEAALSRAPAGDGLWVFAYGSLIWDPCFVHDRRLVGRLPGHCRRFGIWTVLARGTPTQPGLGLGLEPGPGSCTGMLFRLEAGSLDEGLEALWEREMVTGVYDPRWLAVETGDRPIRALTFVTDPKHPQYAGPRAPEECAAIIARAQGKFGSCRDYLANLVESLARMGAHDPELVALLALVDDERAGGSD